MVALHRFDCNCINSISNSFIFFQPLYGLIQAKLELITHAYFDELDFSKVSLLEETYKNLNASLTDSLLDGGSQVFLGKLVIDNSSLIKEGI